MKLTTQFSLLAVLVASVVSLPYKRDVPTNVVPDIQVQVGIKDPAGSANCVGINGGLIPCQCPPDEQTFLTQLNANVVAGHAVNNPSVSLSFPTDSSPQSQITRLEAGIVTFQNMNGPGVGCPATSSTFSFQQQALQAQISGQAAPAPPTLPQGGVGSVSEGVEAAAVSGGSSAPPAVAAVAPPAASSAPASSGTSTLSQLDSLTPQFDVTPGVPDPAGSASCVGINNILIPCTCPPDRNTFLQSLQSDIDAGHAVNNPSVAISFPTDSSAQSEVVRIQASIVALQNLNGPGVGCPASSTTFSAQLSAAQAAARRRRA
jgi:hypothetical protein